ncbi:hypothetical protein KMW28_25590 [Flammeovirga yaeyamensis]|uniref:Uncharacterized protein n=1 Tax=Flammeovirga yaeyamensis TaxID=367791 RepID=A0AAX1N9K5_9BACT|nr:hypothetical protein [Flammeovirga yaeyamensis]MBB3699329.1 hypothetical protein [Flammeovirga yaeyamensis]NMF35409.1 hypothetical protein [Flammeovirga yaeyamensis]QWG04269.1 hypothetical protein KMW28_25590 [Flammeovirga yaeyamensis]
MKRLTPLILFVCLSILSMSFHIIKENTNDPVKENETNAHPALEVVAKINQRLSDNNQSDLKCVYKGGDIRIESKTEVLYTIPFHTENKYVTGFDKHRQLKYLYVLKDDGSQKIVDYHKFI